MTVLSRDHLAVSHLLYYALSICFVYMLTSIQRIYVSVLIIVITAILIGVIRRYGFTDRLKTSELPTRFKIQEIRHELERSIQTAIASFSGLFLFLVLSSFLPWNALGTVSVITLFFTPLGLAMYFGWRTYSVFDVVRIVAEITDDSYEYTTGTVIAVKRLPRIRTIEGDVEPLALDVRLESDRQATAHAFWSKIKSGRTLGGCSVTSVEDLYDEEVLLRRSDADASYTIDRSHPEIPTAMSKLEKFRDGSWWTDVVRPGLIAQAAIWVMDFMGYIATDTINSFSIFIVAWLLSPIGHRLVKE